VPYTIPLANGGFPCVLIGTPMPAPAPGAPAPIPAMPQTGLPAPAPPPGEAPKTLERQAVDFVAANDYARAAAVYEQLQIQNPSNRVYAEAARILRAKAGIAAP
jgi:hypothetical protein